MFEREKEREKKIERKWHVNNLILVNIKSKLLKRCYMQYLLLIVSNFVVIFLLSLVCSFYAFENLSVIVMRGREENDHEVRILFFLYFDFE